MAAIKSTPYYFKVTYNGKNITADLTKNLLEISYTDNVSGVADDLEINLEDADGRWSNQWYPEKGAKLLLEMGYADGRVIKPNAFEIDEIELTGSKADGDVVTIKAISGGVTKQLHTKNSHAHENKTLGEIVRTVAAKYNLTVVGTIADIVINRVTQRHEKDLTFVARLADEYGYAFSVKGDKLNFVKLKDLEGHKKVDTIDKTDCISYSIKDKSNQVYNKATVKSHNPNKNTTVQSSYDVTQQSNNDGVQFAYLKEADNTLEVRTKTENESQANAKSEAALHKANSLQQTADITLPGNVKLLAGNNIEWTGMGRNSGIWNILKSTHKINKSQGYLTSSELKRVVPATQSGSKTTPKVKKTKTTYAVKKTKNLDGIEFSSLIPARDATRVN